jgi:hypothetical protein
MSTEAERSEDYGVQRYDPHWHDEYMAEYPSGEYVKYTDYVAVCRELNASVRAALWLHNDRDAMESLPAGAHVLIDGLPVLRALLDAARRDAAYWANRARELRNSK